MAKPLPPVPPLPSPDPALRTPVVPWTPTAGAILEGFDVGLGTPSANLRLLTPQIFGTTSWELPPAPATPVFLTPLPAPQPSTPALPTGTGTGLGGWSGLDGAAFALWEEQPTDDSSSSRRSIGTRPVPKPVVPMWRHTPVVKPEEPEMIVAVEDAVMLDGRKRQKGATGEELKKGRARRTNRGRSQASEEASEQIREKRRQTKQQKKEEQEQVKNERTERRIKKYMIEQGHKLANINATIAATMSMSAEERAQIPAPCSSAELVDTSILPVGHHLPLQPLQVPFDAFSFDGRFGISVLCMDTKRRDVPTLCRFNFCPQEDAAVLIGESGIADPSESYLYPSLCAAARRANLKPANGWTFFWVCIVHNERTYRVPLIKFRADISHGPGFVQRPGVQYTPIEVKRMCRLASRVHPSTKQYAERRYWEIVHHMGRHRPREVIPAFLEPLLRALPNLITPKPSASVPFGKWTLPPVQRDLAPTFVQFA